VRAKDLNDLAQSALFLFRTRPLGMDDKAKALLEAAGITLLTIIRAQLADTSPWQADHLEAGIRALSEETGVGLGKIAQPLRAALTGSTTSPGIFDVLAVLGRDESLGRIDDQIAQ